ncbi:MAG: Na/Pi cotransporter family protein [Lachnospiraceae bacterium]|nr:Na/Pi cotransporter family protein [Lachnospiraceae bacterium]
MDFFGILSMIGGLSLFLYGMNVMGGGLERLSGGRLERILERLTSNPLKAVLLGAGVTAVIQSSSATTVMLVGFVNSGIMKLSQAIGIIMGANIGTTITSWILSLSGIEGDNFFIQLLKPTSFSPILALIGIIFLMSGKENKKKDIGVILLGFAVLMFGMDAMSAAVKPLANVPEFTGILTKFSNPVLGVLVGALLTAIIQSSSASVGILQALSVTGAFTFGSVIPIIMGQNIGTCVTAMLSSVGATRGAKRTAFVHLYFNMIGAIVFLIFYYILTSLFDFGFVNEKVGVAGIAFVHSIFNIFATLILLPFTKLLEKLAYITLPETQEEREAQSQKNDFPLLDSRFLSTPGFAIEQCKSLTFKMGELSREAMIRSMKLFEDYSQEEADRVEKLENLVDKYDDKLSAYLVQLNSKDLNYTESQSVSTLLHSIGDLERIADHAVNIMELAQDQKKKKLEFSDKAKEELRVYGRAVEDILGRSIRAFIENDRELAMTVEPLEEVVDQLNKDVKKRHIKRLQNGTCTIELGLLLSDIATNYERVSDHCSNLAVYMIQIEDSGFEAHEYVNNLKSETKKQFDLMMEDYKRQYVLP